MENLVTPHDPPTAQEPGTDQQAREQPLSAPLGTEHFVLQAARSAIVRKQIGRRSIYMGAVSSTLIALGFLAPGGHPAGPFVAGLLLPALFFLGELTFAALVRYRGRNVVERCFNRLKQFRAVATRFGKRRSTTRRWW
jgi:hypothetical protein